MKEETAMTILAIDPGPVESAYVIVGDDYRPQEHEKIDNANMRLVVIAASTCVDRVVIEMIGHYGSGMPAGKEVFDTCIWIGRFWEAAGVPVETILRATVKTHLCGMARAKDGNVIQALRDRFGEKGTKKNPGWFYGFRADEWQAYALAVTYLDGLEGPVA